MPSSLSYHARRKREDYSFERSYGNLFSGGTPLTYHTTTADVYAAPPAAARQEKGEWMSWQSNAGSLNGSELIDPIVQQSKFRVPMFRPRRDESRG